MPDTLTQHKGAIQGSGYTLWISTPLVLNLEDPRSLNGHVMTYVEIMVEAGLKVFRMYLHRVHVTRPNGIIDCLDRTHTVGAADLDGIREYLKDYPVEDFSLHLNCKRLCLTP